MGAGSFRYVPQDWGQLPDGWTLGDVGGVAVDDHDAVYVFNRSEHPMIVFDRRGRFLRSWGEGVFSRPHGIDIAHDGAVYCTDDGDHTVRKFTPDGQLLLQIGTPGQPTLAMSGRPFNRCTHTALSPSGDIYVSDGYGNGCVHCFSPSGALLRSWGRPGIGPGEFNIPHNLCCDTAGLVYVADRESHRIQVFDGDGRVQQQWQGVHRPCALCRSKDGLLFVGEVGPGLPINRTVPNLGPRIAVLSPSGELLARIGDSGPGLAVDQFLAPHGIAVDSTGDLYVGEVSAAAWPEIFPSEPTPARLRTLRKLVRHTGCLE